MDNTLQFIPLYIINGKDDLNILQPLRGDYNPFIGESSHLSDIWSLLQHFIDNSSSSQPCFINGDWKFLNTVLGLQAPTSTYPCPVCIVSIDDFSSIDRFRDRLPSDKHSRNPDSPIPLLTVPVDRIVPLPLHLFLGIGNRVLNKILSNSSLINHNNNSLSSSVSSIKTNHTRGCTGLSDLYDMNGPELSRFFDKFIPDNIVNNLIESSGIRTREKKSTDNIESKNFN